MSSSLNFRRVERVRFEPRRRVVYVTGIERPSKGFARITFSSDDLRDFESLSFDDHVKLGFPASGREVLRDFTPLAFDAPRGELTIEFALHAEGPASDWARQARLEEAVVVLGPRGSLVIPVDYSWHLLAGDASALPAIARRLRELPAGSRALALIQIADVADQRRLPTRAEADVKWLHSAADWLTALRALHLPRGEGFAWCAGEAQTMKVARATLLEHHKHPREAMRVSVYWKHGVPDFHEKLDS